VDHDIYQAVFKISSHLEFPVILAALVALAVVLVEVGSFVVETVRRGKRKVPALADAAETARTQIAEFDRLGATATLQGVGWSPAMTSSLEVFAQTSKTQDAEPRIAKELADFDYNRQRRLAVTRLLVRVGPALGLMGTLIPLSPALEGLSNGNTQALTDNLRVAFSVTVLGILIGAIAFGLSLVRDRVYSQDYSDLEYVAAILTSDDEQAVP
jgi:biopolymer transport protein ExbB/TolQ